MTSIAFCSLSETEILSFICVLCSVLFCMSSIFGDKKLSLILDVLKFWAFVYL